MNLLKTLVCMARGHKPESRTMVHGGLKYYKKCSRCGCPLGLPKWESGKEYPPPGRMTKGGIKEWERYFEGW